MLRILLLLSLTWISIGGVQLKEEFSWKHLDFNWCSDREKEHFMKEGLYIPENNFPMGFARYKDRMFVTVPRYKLGVPSSLNYFKISDDPSPKLNPYPWWSENMMPNAYMKNYEYPIDNPGSKYFKWFVSIMRVYVDKCDRLWALDAGQYNISGAKRTMFNPSIIIFNLTNDEIIDRHFLDDSIVEKLTFFGHMIVESDEKNCDGAFAYLSDLGASKLVIYNMKQNKSWDVRHHFFNFEPIESQFNIGDITLRWTDGVVSVALSEQQEDGSRKAYFHSTSASNEYEVSTNVLKNETWAHSYDNYNDYKLTGNRGEGTQSSISIYDEENKLLILSQLPKSGLACWDTAKPLNENTTKLFLEDTTKLDFPADMKIGCDKNLWVLSNKLHKYLYGSINMNEVNFRLSKIPLKEIGAACK